MSTKQVKEVIEAAFARFLAAYQLNGGFRFGGRVESDDPGAYAGPAFWSEDDVAFRFALELEREMPGSVHLELPLARYSRSDLEDGEGNSRVDIALTDMSDFVADGTAGERFKALQHSAFIEVKWLYKGWWGHPRWEMDAIGRVEGVRRDLAALARHLKLGRCSVAAMLVVDEECYFEHHFEDDGWPKDVMRLVASPAELDRRGVKEKAVERELKRIELLVKNDQAKHEKRLAGQKKDRDQAELLLSERERIPQNVKTLRVGAFELAVELCRQAEDVEVLLELVKRAELETGSSWETRHESAVSALSEAKEARARRFTWEEGDIEIITGPIEVDPELEIPQEVKDLIDRRNRRLKGPGDAS